jgi:hypothetical protein
VLRHSAPAKGPGGLMFPPGMQAIFMGIELHAYPTADIPDNTGCSPYLLHSTSRPAVMRCTVAAGCSQHSRGAAAAGLHGCCYQPADHVSVQPTQGAGQHHPPATQLPGGPCCSTGHRRTAKHTGANWWVLQAVTGNMWLHMHPACYMFLAEAGASSPCQCLRAASCQHSRWPGAVHSCQAPCYALQVYPS